MSVAPARTGDEGARALVAGLCLARLGSRAAPFGPWILATIAERLTLPPPGMIVDLGALLVGETFERRRSGLAPGENEELLAALRRYEDAVLGRLAVDARVERASAAVLRLPAELRADAVALFVSAVTSRLRFAGGVEITSGSVRALAVQKPEAVMQQGLAILGEDPSLRRRLAEAYSALARGALETRDLLGEADLFALENLGVLGSLTQRLAAADVARAEEVLACMLPQRVFRRRRNVGDVATRLDDESTYPIGGFASLSTSGSLENLVSSELIYMDTPAGPAANVDLFDMRYVENELLYYARDEAILVRRRRVVVLVLPPELVRARVKDASLPWQRIVLFLAVIAIVTKNLVAHLGDEDLQVRLAFLREGDERTPLGQERALAELLLREWRAKGLVDIFEASAGEIDKIVGAARQRAHVQVVALGGPCGVPFRRGDGVFVEFVTPEASLEAWSDAAADLLAVLV